MKINKFVCLALMLPIPFSVTNAQTRIGNGPGIEITGATGTANAPAENDIAIGRGANATGTGGIALGVLSTASGGENAISVGNESSSTGTQSIAIGSSLSGGPTEAARASGTRSVAIGSFTQAVTEAVSLGDGATATSVRSVAVGNGSSATSTEAVAVGDAASAGGARSVAVGNASSAGGVNAAALGNGSNASGGNSVAIGNGSSATLSSAQTAAQNSAINVGRVNEAETVNATGGQVSIGNRLITGVADGLVNATSSQAVNGSQLHGAITDISDDLDATDANVTINTTRSIANETRSTNNATNISNNRTDIDQNTTDIANILTVQDGPRGADNNAPITVGANTGGAVIDHANISGEDRVLTGVAAGEISATSNDAVNGSQLAATNQNVTNNTVRSIANETRSINNATNIANNRSDIDENTTRSVNNATNISNNRTDIDQNTTDIANILTVQDGPRGADNNAPITVGANTGGAVIDHANISGEDRVLTGVAAGEISATSNDAVNGSQLFGITQGVENNTLAINRTIQTVTINQRNIFDNTQTLNDHRELIEQNIRDIQVLNTGLENTNTRIDDLTDRVSSVEDTANRALQGVALALAAKPQINAADRRGRITIGVATFEGESAAAVSGSIRLPGRGDRYIYGSAGATRDTTGGTIGVSLGF